MFFSSNNKSDNISPHLKQLCKTARLLLIVGIINFLFMLSLNSELLQAITEMPNAVAGATAFLAIYRIFFSLSLGIVLAILSRKKLRKAQRMWVLDNSSTYKLYKASFYINLLTVVVPLLFMGIAVASLAIFQ